MPARPKRNATSVRQLLTESLGYGLASACAFIVDISMLWGLVHFLGWGYLPAAATSFLLGAAVAYKLSTTITFKQRRLENRKAEFACFVAIGGVGLLINGAVMFAGVNLLGLRYLVAKCVAAGFTFACNFILRRQILFTRPAVD